MDTKEIYTTRCHWHQSIDHTLVVDCSDPRFAEARYEFITEYCKAPRHDPLIIPGGPVTSTYANPFCYVDQERIRALHGLHKFRLVIGIVHFDCGYYKYHHPGVPVSDLHKHQCTDLLCFRDTLRHLVPEADVKLYHVGPNADNFIEYKRIV